MIYRVIRWLTTTYLASYLLSTAAHAVPTTISVVATDATLGQPTTFTGHASDIAGRLSQLNFYVNGPGMPGWNFVGGIAISGFDAINSLSWIPPAAGAYSVHIRAFDTQGIPDSNGNVMGTFSVGVTNVPPMTVSVSAPNGTVGNALLLTGSATDGNGNLSYLNFYVNGPGMPGWNYLGNATLSGSNGTASFNWTPPSPGAWAVHIRAFDTNGAVDSNGNVVAYFTVAAPASPPSIQNTWADATTLMTGQSTILHVSATSSSGHLRYVNLDEISGPGGNNYFGPGDNFDGARPPGGGWADIGATTGAFTRDIHMTFSQPGTYRFAGAAQDDQSLFVTYASSNGGVPTCTVTVTASAAPYTNVSAPSFGFIGLPFNISATTTATNGHLISEAIDYSTDGGANWTSGATASGTRWEGDEATHTLASSFAITTPGSILLRARGMDSAGKLSEFAYATITLDDTAVWNSTVKGIHALDNHGIGGRSAFDLLLPKAVNAQTHHGTYDIVLNAFLRIDHQFAGAPNVAPYVFEGQTYYLEAGELANFDYGIEQASANGIAVTLVVLASFDSGALPGIISSIAFDNGEGSRPGFEDDPSKNAPYRAVLRALAERYSGAHGKVQHWVIGNEVDNYKYWYNLGNSTPAQAVAHYFDAVKQAWQQISAVSPTAKVYVSLDHSWSAVTGGSLTSKQLLQEMVTNGATKGDFPWNVAYHPYPVLSQTRPWSDDDTLTPYQYSASYISMRNIEVLNDWLSRNALYNGQARRIILSEQGTQAEIGADGVPDEYIQAAAVAYYYFRCAKLNLIDATEWNEYVDANGGVLGLLYPSLVEKLAFQVYKGVDDPLWYQKLAPYHVLSTMGLQNYSQLLPRPVSTN